MSFEPSKTDFLFINGFHHCKCERTSIPDNILVICCSIVNLNLISCSSFDCLSCSHISQNWQCCYYYSIYRILVVLVSSYEKMFVREKGDPRLLDGTERFDFLHPSSTNKLDGRRVVPESGISDSILRPYYVEELIG